MMTRFCSKVLWIFILFFFNSHIVAQQINPPNLSFNPQKGLWIESADNFMGLHIGFRLQQQLVLTENEDHLKGEFLIRRARTLFNGYLFNKKLEYLVQIGMDRGQVTLLNAEYRWKPNSNTKISIGQFFPPVGRQFQTVSQNFQMVDRSDVTRFFFTDYDLGFALRKTFSLPENFAIKTALAITHGEGKNISTAPGAWAYMGRLELLPFGLFSANGDYSESDLYREPTPKLSLGLAYYLNLDAYTKLGDRAWNGLDDNISEYYFDAVLKYDGLSILAEYINRSVENELLQISPSSQILSNKVSGEGFYVQGGKFVTETIEPTFRVTFLNPNNASQSILNKFIRMEKYSLGLNNFLMAHNIKFQTQISFIREDFQTNGKETYFELLSQFSISF